MFDPFRDTPIYRRMNGPGSGTYVDIFTQQEAKVPDRMLRLPRAQKETSVEWLELYCSIMWSIISPGVYQAPSGNTSQFCTSDGRVLCMKFKGDKKVKMKIQGSGGVRE